MTKQVYLGTKVRRLRRREQMTQAQLAKQLGISASYLNLIEHNKRTLTVPLLLRIAQLFEVDLEGFAADDEAALVADLQEIFADAVFDGQDLTPEDVRDLASHTPTVARAVLGLYRAYRAGREDAQALAARFSDGVATSGLDTTLPWEEVSDMIQERRNYFPALEEAAEHLWSKAQLDQDNLRRGLILHLENAHDVRVSISEDSTASGAARVFDPDKRTLTLSDVLPQPTLVFQIAHQIGLLTLEREFGSILSECRLTTPASQIQARVALANYFAAAVMLPYERILDAAERTRYDVASLQRRMHASFEQVCHRLSTLNRPGQAGVPFHFVRIDIAGNIAKRYSGSGIRISRYSGACPRWNVHTAFMTPGQIHTQLSRMPDGSTYFCIARTVLKAGGGHLAPQSHLAVGLGCRIEHAKKLVYSDGINLENLDAAVPIGAGCRICERTDCMQRAFPPLDQRMAVDVNRRGLSFYSPPA